MTMNCQKCGTPIGRQNGPGGRRKFCATCSPKRERNRRAAPPGGSAISARTPTATPAAEHDRPNVSAATQRELQAASVALDSWRAVVCMLLARRIDAGDETANGLTALVKVHREILAEALAQAEPLEENPLERIRRLRGV